MTETERQNLGIPLFTDKKVKDGWVLNLIKQNNDLLSTSLYNSSGTVIENKMFEIQKSDQIDKLKEYIDLFESGPEQNYRKMIKIKLR